MVWDAIIWLGGDSFHGEVAGDAMSWPSDGPGNPTGLGGVVIHSQEAHTAESWQTGRIS